jgi:hypothetical protein
MEASYTFHQNFKFLLQSAESHPKCRVIFGRAMPCAQSSFNTHTTNTNHQLNSDQANVGQIIFQWLRPVTNTDSTLL